MDTDKNYPNNSSHDGHHFLRETRKEPGKIVSIVAQGDKVYAIVRLKGKFTTDDEGNKIIEEGKIAGNIANLPEDQLTLAEILIDTDIDLSSTYAELDQYIGRKVKVEYSNGIPSKVISKVSQQNARSISKRELWSARNVSPDKSLTSQEAKNYLKGRGYDDEEIEEITSETVSSVSPEGYELSYGDTVTWNRSVTPKTTKDIEPFISKESVSELPKENTSNKRCYRPAKVLTAR